MNPFHVVANLPYSVGTPLMVDLVQSDYRPATLTLMLQLEVAERVCAVPGEMGLLSLLVQSFATVDKLFEVPAGAFWPPAKDPLGRHSPGHQPGIGRRFTCEDHHLSGEAGFRVSAQNVA